MTHTFTHDGKDWTLFKHAETVRRFRAGLMTEAEFQRQPWYIRLTMPDGTRRRIPLKTHVVNDAVREAKAVLRSRHKPTFTALLDEHRMRETITLGRIHQEWAALRCPKPNGETRTEEQIARLAPVLDIALRWWADRGAATVRPRDLHDYCAHRRATCRAGSTGERAVDLELNALSCLCEWAVATERIAANPFATRPRFQSAARVVSCHNYMPASDEELHALIREIWGDPSDLYRMVAGAHLLACALTGLRPGEPGALLRPQHAATGRLPGAIYTVEGEAGQVTKMAVRRLKRGQNLAIVVRPAFRAFLTAWESWLDRQCPTARLLFPHPERAGEPLVGFGEGGDKVLRRALDAACTKLGVPERHPHGMRAFYVRVRRAHDCDDATIASELGQSGGEVLIRRTYGDPQDVRGDRAFDWMPNDGAPCWSILGASYGATAGGHQTHPNASCQGAFGASEPAPAAPVLPMQPVDPASVHEVAVSNSTG